MDRWRCILSTKSKAWIQVPGTLRDPINRHSRQTRNESLGVLRIALGIGVTVQADPRL